MARQLLGAAVLGLALLACSSQPLGEDTESATTEVAAGSVSLPLVTTTPDKVSYRLRLAKFTISGPALGGKPRVITPLADIEVHNEPLPTGNYSITLEKGWVLERRGPEEAAYAAITASLVTPNPMEVEVTGYEAAEALFGFVTTSGEVSLGNGSVNVRIGVQTCDVFDSYMASLGTLTAACLGTVDPRHYSLNADGYLVPNFDQCTSRDQSALRSIQQLLSLQYMSASLPTAKACLAGRYSTALAKFLETDTEVCPSLKFVATENPITHDVIAKVEQMLPELPSTEPLPAGIIDGDQPLLKTFNLYEAVFEGTAPQQRCGSASNCALACMSTFPGFAVGITKTATGLEVVRTDPDSWLETTTYLTAADDPYLRPLFYHPMSYFGGAPGVQFGNPRRAMPCGLDANKVPVCPGESCSYWTGSSHKRTRLQLRCNDYTNGATCSSYCGPALPPPDTIPAL
jgi:hypothetical protein